MAFKRGDRLIHNRLGPVEAVGDEHDGTLKVRDDRGIVWGVSVYDVRYDNQRKTETVKAF